MTGPTGVDDRELEAVLAGRATRSARADDRELLAAVGQRIAATGQVRLVPLVPVAWERVAWLGSIAVALMIGLTAGLVGPRWLQGIGATAVPSATGETTSPTATTLEASTGERGLKIPMLPEQLAAAIPRLDGQLVIVQGRMDPERVPCPTGPAGCWAGRLAGYAGPPILAAPDGPADWDGSAVGRPVLAIDRGEARYVGQLGMSGAMRVAHPSTLVKPLDDADGLVLVEGRVNADCGASSGGCSIGIDDGISAGEVLQPVLAEPGRPPAHGGVGRFVLRWGDVAHSCPSTTGPGAPSCASPIGLPWTFVGWVAGDAIRTQPVPTCDGVDGDLCAALADLAVGDTPDVVSIDVGPFADRCARSCPLPAHGVDAPPLTHEVTATLTDGSGRSWACDSEGSDLGCRYGSVRNPRRSVSFGSSSTASPAGTSSSRTRKGCRST